MALEKVISEDKIEIVGEFKAVQVRTCTKVLGGWRRVIFRLPSPRYNRRSGLQQRVSGSTGYLCRCAYRCSCCGLSGIPSTSGGVGYGFN